eukprot:CAMPEP_0116562870 /NCGR_PEP_ID=MMETSP0397-20121206/12410_1 /TAXON_ID=216820 /ORGANISM="Cyclophora tenuis, Strain ECT3854" /LENGTH=124 /DNA_ID=CAMNT_0004089235 /DNA_START=99 /DNA_END=473 /DNA_ORIENTATION=-
MTTRSLSSSTTTPGDNDNKNGEGETNADLVTKADIINIIADEHDLSKAKSGRILDSVLDLVVESLSQNRTVRLASFGRFEARKVESYKGRNPQTGETLVIPESMRVRFRPFSAFKDNINKKKQV